MTTASILILFGLLYRIRGGLLPLPSTTLARLAFAVPFGAYLAHVLGVLYSWTTPVLIAAVFVGLLFGWGRFYHMRNMPKDILLMCGRGALLTAPAALVMVYMLGLDAGWVYALYGAGIGVIYALARLQRILFGWYMPYTELAEYLTGAYLAGFGLLIQGGVL